MTTRELYKKIKFIPKHVGITRLWKIANILKMNDKYINVEGIILPDDSLWNFQLINAANKLKFKHFKGVFLRDELPKKPELHECGILNTGDSLTGGYHWICWFKDGRTKLSFDFYGLPPPTELVDHLKSPVYYNSQRVIYDGTVFCGHLCLYILKKTWRWSRFSRHYK